jgi:hypothetical protein
VEEGGGVGVADRLFRTLNNAVSVSQRSSSTIKALIYLPES